MSLEFDTVSYTYPGTSHGVTDISLKAAPGELLAVIGQSGSGKSTLLRLTAGLLTGHTGRIVIGGQDVADQPVWQRGVGVVFQQYALFPHLSVADNVAYGLKMRGMDSVKRRRQALAMLDRVGLASHADRRPAHLSGGQQQRVALARALVIEPRVLLLDEPLAALDAGIRHQLRDEICTLQRDCGATTLFVTHDQDEALSMADRVAIVDGGRVLQVGTPRELYEAPASVRVARFIGHSTVLSGRVVATDRIDVGFTTLCAATGAHRPGDAVDLLLRPEHVQADPQHGCANRIHGTHGIVRYFGSTHRYDFLVAGTNGANGPSGTATPLLGEGPVVATHSIAIEPRHLRVLPAAPRE
ncbi:ABC transporter ATP-binding protein [Paraburkholderia sp.]|uniref:ABC transporter ATP-binding protein n=1 Tax=Paraburkholderia sp. TaxID=1926495 RepID=UPI0025EAAA88|nr:ABC transporter ATP-binding protein [Paraburkholderia sp.]